VGFARRAAFSPSSVVGFARRAALRAPVRILPKQCRGLRPPNCFGDGNALARKQLLGAVCRWRRQLRAPVHLLPGQCRGLRLPSCFGAPVRWPANSPDGAKLLGAGALAPRAVSWASPAELLRGANALACKQLTGFPARFLPAPAELLARRRQCAGPLAALGFRLLVAPNCFVGPALFLPSPAELLARGRKCAGPQAAWPARVPNSFAGAGALAPKQCRGFRPCAAWWLLVHLAASRSGALAVGVAPRVHTGACACCYGGHL
jgi:hypothetical protein